MKFSYQCVLIFSIWLALSFIFAIVILVKKKSNEYDDCSLRAWYLIGSITYFLVSFLTVKVIPRNIAKEYLKMTEEMALDASCVSPLEMCENAAFSKFKKDPANRKKAMSACEGKPSKTKCTEKLIKKCGKLMASKSPAVAEQFKSFSDNAPTKETLSFCKNAAASNVKK
jgi:hypothetical protein